MEVTELFKEIERWSAAELSNDYLELLIKYGGTLIGGYLRIYAAEEVIERNETFETKLYYTGYISIGDDSGGRAVVISVGKESGPVFMVDHGSMNPSDFKQVAPNLNAWLESMKRIP